MNIPWSGHFLKMRDLVGSLQLSESSLFINASKIIDNTLSPILSKWIVRVSRSPCNLTEKGMMTLCAFIIVLWAERGDD